MLAQEYTTTANHRDDSRDLCSETGRKCRKCTVECAVLISPEVECAVLMTEESRVSGVDKILDKNNTSLYDV